MDSISSAFSSLKGGSPQEKKETIKAQVSQEIAMANVSRTAGPMSFPLWQRQFIDADARTPYRLPIMLMTISTGPRPHHKEHGEVLRQVCPLPWLFPLFQGADGMFSSCWLLTLDSLADSKDVRCLCHSLPLPTFRPNSA